MTTTQAQRPRRRVVILCRISDDREGKRWGVARQEKVCRERADRNEWDVVAVLVENDVSAYSGKPRPKYQRLLEMLRTGEADAVLALSVKRLQRNWRDAFAFLDLAEERDIAIDTIKAGRYNLNTAEGRAQARRAAIDAQEESEEIGERVRDAKADNIREGTYRGGPRPFGYETDGVTPRTLECSACPGDQGFSVDRECLACGAVADNAIGSEAWYTEKATDAVIAGDSLRSICRHWAANEVRTVARRYKQEDGTRGEPKSREWMPEELRGLLLRPRNAGLMEHKGEIVGRAAWAPIVSEEKWRACRDILMNPERRTTTGNARVWLGSGLYLCGTPVCQTAQDRDRPDHDCEDKPDECEMAPCPETMRCSTSGKGSGRAHVPAYRCRSGGHVTRVAGPLDEYVERVAIDRLQRSDAVELLLPPPPKEGMREDLAAAANALRAKLEGLAADYVDDLITRQQMLDGTALTRKRLEKIEAEMAALAKGSVLAALPLGTDEIEKQWGTYHLDKRRAIVDALMTVRILPARRGRPPGYKPGVSTTYFDPRAVAIEWKKPVS
ncbi:recombinase family protein [Streptomyces klenkii]|uniref:recombinase family protein n=1 Tax=Streptomyces klenkii TaxID=1420899 RepID=UPI0036EDB2B6